MKEEKTKRLFFGVDVHAPWPSKLPKGRLLDENHRHFTLAFLGNIPFKPLNELLAHFPKANLHIGTVGYFDTCLTLPPRHPSVIAWHAEGLDGHHPLIPLQNIIADWLKTHGYVIDERVWNPHVTLCREPFDQEAWKKEFHPLPYFTGGLHLYESIGNLQYVPIWSYPLKFPFEEIDHTADIAFLIRGHTLQQIYQHAFIALAFKFPDLLQFFQPMEKTMQSLDDVIIALNAIIARADGELGCPFKAVSFHGEMIPIHDELLQWEMIVDV